MLKKARLAQLVKMFYDPEGLISHQKQLDRDRIRSAEEKKNQKATEEEQAVLA